MKHLVDAVKQYALDHYGWKAWDEVVECWSDDEIAEEIAGCTSPAQAIAKMARYVNMKHDFIEDIRNA